MLEDEVGCGRACVCVGSLPEDADEMRFLRSRQCMLFGEGFKPFRLLARVHKQTRKSLDLCATRIRVLVAG